MRIALVILHADPSRGGAERYTVDLAEALAGRGHEVSVVASSFAGGEVPRLRDASRCSARDEKHVSVGRVELAAKGLTRAGHYRHFLDLLDRHLATESYDIVHAMLPVRRCDVYHPHAGIAAAMSRRGDWLLRPRRGAMGRVERELLVGCGERPGDKGTRGQGEKETRRQEDPGPVVLCLSQYVKGAIRRVYDLPEDRLATLFNAADLGRFDPGVRDEAGEERECCTGLMIANDFERKGLGVAIEAVGKMGGAVRLIVVGKEDAGRYKEMAAKAQAAVEFVGAVADPRRFYRAADFFVLPTRHDPCSLVVLEALAMGLPVISTKFNGACEIMTDGVHGYVLEDPGDIEALAGGMRRMLDPQLRRRMREACLGLRPRLSYEHHLDELLRIYETVRGCRPAGREIG